jgi:hypothetical protein
VLTAPEQILYKVRKGKIHNPLKEVINQLFTFRPVCTTSKLKALYYRLNFFLWSPLINHLL